MIDLLLLFFTNLRQHGNGYNTKKYVYFKIAYAGNDSEGPLSGLEVSKQKADGFPNPNEKACEKVIFECFRFHSLRQRNHLKYGVSINLFQM